MTNNLTTDEILLQNWRDGDLRSGDELFRRYYDSILRFFVSKVGLQCNDLIQDTFTGCLEGLHRFRGDSSFRTLLFAIARNKLYSYYRRRETELRRFDPGSLSSCDLGLAAPAGSKAGPESKLLLEALQRLPLETQAMLELHYWEGMSMVELGVVFEKPVGTIKSRMRKGRITLELLLEELSEDPRLARSTIRGLERWANELAVQYGRTH